MAGKTYVVTAELATPYREDGSRAYLYAGTEWPDGLREGETERFLDLGFIGEPGSSDSESKAPAKKASSKAPASKSDDK